MHVLQCSFAKPLPLQPLWTVCPLSNLQDVAAEPVVDTVWAYEIAANKAIKKILMFYVKLNCM